MARVCCDPLMEARSGKVSAAIAWKVMFAVPVIRIASSAGLLPRLGLVRGC